MNLVLNVTRTPAHTQWFDPHRARRRGRLKFYPLNVPTPACQSCRFFFKRQAGRNPTAFESSLFQQNFSYLRACTSNGVVVVIFGWSATQSA